MAYHNRRKDHSVRCESAPSQRAPETRCSLASLRRGLSAVAEFHNQRGHKIAFYTQLKFLERHQKPQWEQQTAKNGSKYEKIGVSPG